MAGASMWKSWAAGIGAAIVSIVLLSYLLGPVTCRDGWHSLSIGRSGACSHHGGVSGHGWATLISLIIGICVGLWVESKQNPPPTVRK
jgi:Na+-driven multidrug efflux pump